MNTGHDSWVSSVKMIFDEKEKNHCSLADAKGVTGDQGCLPRLAIDQNLLP